MKYEYIVSYNVVVDDEKVYPFLVKIGTTTHTETLYVHFFKNVEYFFVDTHQTRDLILWPDNEQTKTLKNYGIKSGILKYDLVNLTGAAKWQLVRKKRLYYRREYLQPNRSLFTDLTFLHHITADGSTPAEVLERLARPDNSDLEKSMEVLSVKEN